MGVILNIDGATTDVVQALTVHEATTQNVAVCYSVSGLVDPDGWVLVDLVCDCPACASILEMKWPTE